MKKRKLTDPDNLAPIEVNIAAADALMDTTSANRLTALPHLNCYRIVGVASSEMLPTAPHGTIKPLVRGRQRNGDQDDARITC